MIARWQPLPDAPPSVRVVGSFYDLPEEVQARAATLPERSCLHMFVTERSSGFTTRGRGVVFPRAGGSSPRVVLEHMVERGSSSSAIHVDGRVVLRWHENARPHARRVAEALAWELGAAMEERDLGVIP